MRILRWSFVLSLTLGSAALATGGGGQAPTALTTTDLTQGVTPLKISSTRCSAPA